MTSLRPPQAPPKWNFTAEEVLSSAQEAIEHERRTHDQVAALDHKDCNFQSVFTTLAISESIFRANTEPLKFLCEVSPSEATRNAFTEAETLFNDFITENSRRLDVFEAKIAAEKNMKSSGEWEALKVEQQRLVNRMILDGTRAGLGLEEHDREKLKALYKELKH